MGVYPRIEMLIISLALAASGILTCGLALSDIFLPRGSALAVLALIPLLGAVWLRVSVSLFAWTCELLDRRGWLRGPTRTARKASKPSTGYRQHPRAEPGLHRSAGPTASEDCRAVADL